MKVITFQQTIQFLNIIYYATVGFKDIKTEYFIEKYKVMTEENLKFLGQYS